MGSITSRPKAPSTPQVVYMPAPTPVTVTTPAADAETQNTDAQGASEAREENLLTRDRSRYGTVKTGFKGLLSVASADNGARKTLLGE